MKDTTKLYLGDTVYNAALSRIRWLFQEFPNINVSFSGGKDSTVTLNLALQVAEEQGRLPLPVLFIDQEAEWDLTIEYVRSVMSDPRVKPYWYQIPFRLFNATSESEEWLHCWDDAAREVWIRPKEPESIHDNYFPGKVDRFYKVFTAHLSYHFEQPVANLSGVRCSESMSRFRGLTSNHTYGGETWGTVQNLKRGHYNFYPLYDWGDSDIWKAIHDNAWEYCKIYDIMYQYGVSVKDMRVSSLTHENAVRHLFYLQEFEGDTWNRMTRRMKGVNTAKHLQMDMVRCPDELPFMFGSWREYRDYLLVKMVSDEGHREKLRHQFSVHDERYREEIHDKMHKMHIGCILTGDRFNSKLGQFENSHAKYNRYTQEEIALKKTQAKA